MREIKVTMEKVIRVAETFEVTDEEYDDVIHAGVIPERHGKVLEEKLLECYAANCGRRKQRFIFGVFSSPTAQSVRRRHDHGGTTARSHRPVSGHQTTWCFETGL